MAGDDREVLAKKQLLVLCLRDASARDCFSESLRGALRDALASADCERALRRAEYRPSGLDIERVALSSDEKKLLKLELDKYIIEEFPKLLTTFKTIGCEPNKNLKRYNETELTVEEQKLLKLCNDYYTILFETKHISISMCAALKEWIDLRLTRAPKTLLGKAKLGYYEKQLLELKVKILNVQLNRFVYTKENLHTYMDYYEKTLKTLEHYNKQISEYKKKLGYDDTDECDETD